MAQVEIKETVIVFCGGLLPSTQTFIIAQVDAVKDFAVQYAGLLYVDDGLRATPEPILLTPYPTSRSKWREIAYKIFGFAPQFYSAIGRTRPSLIHAHFLMDGVLALPLANHFKVPLIVTLHGHVPTGAGKVLTGSTLDGQLYKHRLPALWRRASKFICVSEFIRQKALALGFPEEKLLLHYIGIDLDLFKPLNGPRDPDMVLFVGRLVEKKGCSYLLEAMRLVQAQHPSAHLVIVGKGPNKVDLEAKALAYGLRCSFVGNRTHAEVLAYVRQARVFCAPSITAADGDAEALGMVFAEAEAVGLPVVSFKHGGIPEVVKHGVTGLLAPEKDVPKLAEYLLRYLKDDAFWESCSSAGIEFVRDRFDIHRQTSELERIYQSCLTTKIRHAVQPILLKEKL